MLVSEYADVSYGIIRIMFLGEGSTKYKTLPLPSP